MKPLALILARAGSKGLPGKNRAPVADRPCFLWTVDDARAARHPARLAISTDDEDILRSAIELGVDAVLRPAELATDSAPVDDAARHAVRTLDDDSLDPIVLLYANAPVRPAGLIDRALDQYATTGADSVQSYAAVGKHHPWWTARLDASTGAVTPWEGDTLNHGVFRRQDLPGAVIPDGGVLVVSRRALMLEIPDIPSGPHAFLGADRRGVLTNEGDVIDIDSAIDLRVADAVLRERTADLAAQRPAPGQISRCAP